MGPNATATAEANATATAGAGATATAEADAAADAAEPPASLPDTGGHSVTSDQLVYLLVGVGLVVFGLAIIGAAAGRRRPTS